MSDTKAPIQNEAAIGPVERISSADGFSRALETYLERNAQAEARGEILRLMAEIRYRAERARILDWTKEEQRRFFAQLDELFQNPGRYVSGTPRQASTLSQARAIAVEELEGETAQARRIGSVFDTASGDVAYNFPLIDVNTTVVPLELHLVFDESETSQTVLARLKGQYRGRYTAAIVQAPDGKVRGLVSSEDLERAEPDAPISTLALRVPPEYPTIQTRHDEAERLMAELGVNVLPVVEPNTLSIIGVLARESVIRVETRFYTTKLATGIEIDRLHDDLGPTPAPQSSAA